MNRVVYYTKYFKCVKHSNTFYGVYEKKQIIGTTIII